MKVLIYTHEYPPFRGGIATSSQKIANILKDKFNVVVCCPKYRNTSSSSSNNLKIKRMNLIGGDKFKKIPLLQYIQGFFHLKRSIREEKPDYILYLGEEAEIVGGLVNEVKLNQIVRIAGSGIKSILENKNPSKTYKKFLMKRLYKNSKYIIAVSNNTKNLLIKSNEFKEVKKIKLIYNGLEDEFIKKEKDYSLRNKLGFEEDDFILLTISRILPRKGQDNVIKALSKIKNKKIKYLCVGDGGYIKKFKKLSKNLNIDNRILFVGGIDRKDSTKYYDIADAFILCNRTWNNKIEGLPNVVLEAMGRSKPVIGSKNSGTEELIIEGETGYIVDPENIQDIKEIIISASENRNQLKVMGDNALNFIQKNFSNKKMEEEYIRILNEN